MGGPSVLPRQSFAVGDSETDDPLAGVAETLAVVADQLNFRSSGGNSAGFADPACCASAVSEVGCPCECSPKKREVALYYAML
jgi:hypothetical protein